MKNRLLRPSLVGVTKEGGAIVQEIQKGYMMKGRLLRPSLVGVTKKREEKAVKDGKKTEETEEKK